MKHENGFDEIYVQMWNYFTGDDGTYDHGSMPKIMRVSSSNNSITAIDLVITLNDNDNNHDSESVAIRYNGGPNDWGAAYGSYSVPNNKWISFELHVKLNTPGKNDGLVELYIDGVLKAKKYNINIRDKYSYKINSALVGGWYSNSGKSSNQWNYRYIDDVVISTEPINNNSNTSSGSSSSNGSLPPQYISTKPPAPSSIRVISIF